MNRKTKLGLLLAILLAAILGIATKSMNQGRGSADSKSHLDDGDLPMARSGQGVRETGSEPRVTEAGSKLRSLFDVRKGEVAALSVPPEIMKPLLSAPIPQSPDGPVDFDPKIPRLVGTLNRQSSIRLLQPAEDSIKGVVDTSEDSFELNVGKMKVSGSAIGHEGFTDFQMMMHVGSNATECALTVPDGSCFLLSSGGENPEGVLIVAGPRESKELKRESNQ